MGKTKQGVPFPDDLRGESVFTSQDPAAIAWRRAQAHVDCDIEGMRRDPAIEALLAQWDAEGITIAERIARLKALPVDFGNGASEPGSASSKRFSPEGILRLRGGYQSAPWARFSGPGNC